MEIHGLDILYPAPEDGKPGKDAVNYVIVCSNQTPNVTDGDVTVSLTAYKIEGSKRTLDDMSQHVFFIDGERAASTSNPLRVTIQKGNTSPKLVYLRDQSVMNTFAECSISPVVNGNSGEVGPMMYYAGEWQAGVAYVRTSRVVPLVSHGDDKFFYYPAKEGTLTGNEPSSTNKSWEQQQMVPLLLAQMAMVNFGKIASAVFSGDFMISQYGKERYGSGYRDIDSKCTAAEIGAAYSRFEAEQPDDGDFVPNLYLNFLTGLMRSVKMKAYDMEAHGGTFENVTVSGLLKGVSGTFKKLSYSEDNNVYIGFSSDGKIWFYGDIQHQGSDPTEHRSYRFLSNDIWCRGAFGHREKLMAWVRGSYMYVYPKGTDGNEVKINLDSYSFGGTTYYNIPLYSPKYNEHSEVAGMPIDVVVFNCSSGLHYNFINKGPAKEWTVINGNDNQSVFFGDIGGWHELTGGQTLTCTYIPQKFLSPQSCKIGNSIGEGIFWTGTDLNWAK